MPFRSLMKGATLDRHDSRAPPPVGSLWRTCPGGYRRIFVCKANLYVVFAVWTIHLAVSLFYGPAEWAWRSLTYWKKQPFRRPEWEMA